MGQQVAQLHDRYMMMMMMMMMTTYFGQLGVMKDTIYLGS
jgi:hypothetical protein